MYACTHALVFAQLISNGVNHGFSGFMVQLRNPDGKLMEGVEVRRRGWRGGGGGGEEERANTLVRANEQALLPCLSLTSKHCCPVFLFTVTLTFSSSTGW
jgi:hypothetical protein